MKKGLASGIIILFIMSSITPIVFGYNQYFDVERDEINDTLANLRYLCTTPTGFDQDKYEHYKDMYLGNLEANDEIANVEEFDFVVEQDKTNSYFTSPLSLTLGPINLSWPMKCHDLHHTGRSTFDTSDINYNELWAYRFDSSMHVSPAIGSDGTIYVGGSFEGGRDHLYAINPDGTYKWKYKTDDLIWYCCPAIAEDGTIYIGSSDDCLHAVNPNGTRKWKFDSGKSIDSSPAIGSDGTIYFGTMAGAGTIGKIFAINPDGSEKWQYSTDYHIMSDPAIGNDGTIYIGSGDCYIYAMNPSGSLKWRYKTGDWIRGPPSIADDGTVYIGSWDDYLYALYPNGTLRWRTYFLYGSNTNPTLGTDGTIYTSSATKLYAIEPEFGDILWEFNLRGGSTKSSPAMCADEIIYIAVEIGDRDGGELVAVNSDGTLRWRSRLSNYMAESSPAIGDDGTIYICSTSRTDYSGWGYLHAFNELDPNAPSAPTITGPLEGIPEETYDYTFSVVDPNGDDVFYQIYWGNGEDLNWIGPYSSGEEVVINHTYYWEGTFRILARAKDANDKFGPWSEFEVTMPINQKVHSYPILDWFSERFPILYKMLSMIIY